MLQIGVIWAPPGVNEIPLRKVCKVPSLCPQWGRCLKCFHIGFFCYTFPIISFPLKKQQSPPLSIRISVRPSQSWFQSFPAFQPWHSSCFQGTCSVVTFCFFQDTYDIHIYLDNLKLKGHLFWCHHRLNNVMSFHILLKIITYFY